MLFYTHLVWSLDLESFFGSAGWMSPEAVARMQGLYGHVELFRLDSFDDRSLDRAYRGARRLRFVDLGAVQPGHGGARVSGDRLLRQSRWSMALFGLDDINALLAMYLDDRTVRRGVFARSSLEAEQGRAGAADRAKRFGKSGDSTDPGPHVRRLFFLGERPS